MNLIKKIENNKYFDFSVILIIIIIGYFVMASITNHIGLFYDSVNPDHLAKLFSNMIKNHDNLADLIYLGKEYHGLINTYVMSIVLFFSGAPSVSLLHFVNVTYGTIICIMSYLIMKKCNADKLIAAFISILLSISSALSLIYITQFYVELSGMVFGILAINTLVNYIKNKKISRLFLLGLFSGIACYGYYNYCFFVLPYMVIIIIENHGDKKKIFDSIMMYITGFILGIFPYFLGYTQIAFKDNHKRLAFYGVSIFLLSWIVMSYRIFKNDNKKMKKYSIIGLITIIVFSLIYYARIILLSFNTKISSNNYGFFEKIVRQVIKVKDCFFGLVTGSTSENRLFLHSILEVKNIVYYVSILLFLLGIVISFVLYKKKKQKNKSLLYLFIFYSLFFIVAFVIAKSALSPQHFVPMHFINGIMSAIVITYLISFIKNKKIYSYCKLFICLILIIEILLNMKTNKIIVQELYYTGGPNTFFSEKINEISYSAMDKKNQGLNEYYIFEEWGYTTSFIYLTNYSIPSIERFEGDIDIDEIMDLLENFQVVVVSNKDETLSKNKKILEENEDKLKYDEEVIYKRNGESAYHKLIINKK